jgi:hypothetical protein
VDIIVMSDKLHENEDSERNEVNNGSVGNNNNATIEETTAQIKNELVSTMSRLASQEAAVLNEAPPGNPSVLYQIMKSFLVLVDNVCERGIAPAARSKCGADRYMYTVNFF